jgi:predicted nucleotidyltransferase
MTLPEAAMKTIDFVRDHKSAIGAVLEQYHVRNPRYVPDETEEADVVLLVQPEGAVSYFDVFKMEDALAAELHAKVTILTEGALKGSYRDRILSIAEKV